MWISGFNYIIESTVIMQKLIERNNEIMAEHEKMQLTRNVRAQSQQRFGSRERTPTEVENAEARRRSVRARQSYIENLMNGHDKENKIQFTNQAKLAEKVENTFVESEYKKKDDDEEILKENE